MEQTTTAVTEKPKTFVQAVFGDVLTKGFLVNAAVNLVKAFLHSFLITLSGHVMYYVSEKLVPKIGPVPSMPRGFNSPMAPQSSVVAPVAPGYTSSSYPVLNSSKQGDDRFPGFIR